MIPSPFRAFRNGDQAVVRQVARAQHSGESGSELSIAEREDPLQMRKETACYGWSASCSALQDDQAIAWLISDYGRAPSGLG